MPNNFHMQPRGGKHAQHKEASTSSHHKLVAWCIFSAILSIVLAAMVWSILLYSQAKTIARKEQAVLSSITTLAEKTQTALNNNDAQSIANLKDDAAISQIQEDASAANHLSHSANWRFLSHLPIIGDDVKIVQQLTQASHEASQQAITPLLSTISSLPNQQLSDNGQLNLQPLADINSQLNSVNQFLDRFSSTVEKLPQAHFSPVVKVQQKIDTHILPWIKQFRAGMDSMNYLAEIASSPDEKTIILASATPAEIHSSAGLIGSLGSLTIGNNRITIGQFQPNAYFERQGKIIDSPEAQRIFNGYGQYYSMDIRDVTLDPDFDHVAEHIIQAWQASEYRSPNKPLGVLLVDPLFVQHLIKQTGPVTLPTGFQVTGDNAADYLQNGVYLQTQSATQQDAIFALVTAQTIDSITSNLEPLTALKIAKNIPQFAQDRHISFYSTDARLQQLAETQNLTPRAQHSEQNPQVGFYINSDMASKMDYYSQRSVEIKQTAGPTLDGEEGQRTYTVTLTVKNTLDPQMLSSLPLYIHGDQPGHLVEILLAYAPRGGSIRSLTAEKMSPDTWNGKHLLHTRYNILPGQQVQYTFEVTTSPKATTGLTADQSPQTR